MVGLAVSVTPRILMVAVALTFTPWAPVAVAVNVVVAVGTIVVEPDRSTVVTSSPRTEGVMATAVALVLAQVRVVLCPAATTPGAIARVMVGAEPDGTTVTVIVEVAVRPFASVAVPVYVVVWDGETVADPASGSVPFATAGEMENVAPLVTFQVSVVLCPWTMVLD